MAYRIRKSESSLAGEIFLSGSKSISNRVLIIEALGGVPFEKRNLANARDTVLLQQLLQSNNTTFDAQDAGTTFRFLTAYLAFKEGEWILTGNERMQQRPVGDLVSALTQLGAEISFLEKENYPPLRIIGGKLTGNHVRVNANISSQFVSALLLIAPHLPEGLTIEMAGDVVSEPYINMTLSVLKYLGVYHERAANSIHVAPQSVQAKNIFIESDWSAASYYYEMAAFAKDVELTLHGLLRPSFQGDSMISTFMESFGVVSGFAGEKVNLKKTSAPFHPNLHFHLLPYPDLAPAMFVVAGGLSRKVSFSGLEHLAYKESNREEVLKTELAKCGIHVMNSNGTIIVNGKFSAQHPHFTTYQDHRIAMAFAPLAMLCDEVFIEDPLVVNKSYPEYWDHLRSLGFEVEDV